MVRYLPNGQWTLNKSAEESERPSIHGLMGKTHTVEVHPHIDQLYRVKGLIQNSGKPHMQLGELKRAGVFNTDIIPRDAKGKVTPEVIDKHIEKLPKHKVQIKITPYDMAAQQHRHDVPQYVASVGLHPDTLKGMDEKHKHTWEHIKNSQHDLGGHKDQIGWARIDPHKVQSKPSEKDPSKVLLQDRSTNHYHVPNDKHWHLDEIQSDFGNKDKIKDKLKLDPGVGIYEAEKASDPKHPLHEDWKKMEDAYVRNDDPEYLSRSRLHAVWKALVDKAQALKEKEHKEKGVASEHEMHKLLSHSHEDPQHLVHSAVNQLARQHGIESMSMDTPKDQARQSGLDEYDEDERAHDDAWNAWNDARIQHHNIGFTPERIQKDIRESNNKYLKGALEKAPHDALRKLLDDAGSGDNFNSGMLRDWLKSARDNPDTITGDLKNAIIPVGKQLNDQEIDAVVDYLRMHHDEGPTIDDYPPEAYMNPNDKREEKDLPVHQINTYDKRPKKLGMFNYPKSTVLGRHPSEDPNAEIQYGRLYKKLKLLQDLLKAGDLD